MPTAVVTGANSGIGWRFAEKLIEEGYTVYACDIFVDNKIKTLDTPHKHTLDVTSPPSIQAFTSAFGSQPLDLLLNIAGIMFPKDQDSLQSTSLSVLEKTFAVNTFGPLLLTQALLPNLLKAPNPKVGNMSSRVGSMADNRTGGSYAYRASKAALNSVSKSLAVDLKEKGVVVVILHPGIVRTGLDGSRESWKAEGAVEPEVAVSRLWGVLMGKGIEETGRFWHRDGYELEW